MKYETFSTFVIERIERFGRSKHAKQCEVARSRTWNPLITIESIRDVRLRLVVVRCLNHWATTPALDVFEKIKIYNLFLDEA